MTYRKIKSIGAGAVWVLLALFFIFTPVCSAELFLPSVFSDHMVLQRDQPVPVWGKADPGATVTVEFAGQIKTTEVDSSNHWKIVLDPMPVSSNPRKMTVSSTANTPPIQYADILVGEVWLCAGQSNMQLAFVRQRPGGPVCENAEAEMAAANHPQIRLYNTPRIARAHPVEKIDAEWDACTPETVKTFSACAYYFGRKLHQDLKVPVGLLLCAWGNTEIEPWTPPCGFESVDSLAQIVQKTRHLEDLPKVNAHVPSAIYNGMVVAHIPFSIRGAIWYQGENNRRNGMLYVDKTRALLNGWRTLWGTEFPFYFVQLGAFDYPEKSADMLPRFWEAQSEIANVIPNTGMAVITDVSTLDDIHPPNKKTPGTRLALLAEAKTYGMDVVCSGPVFQCLEKKNDQLTVVFSSAEGLATRDGKAPDWFEIAGKDGVFKPANAKIEKDRVVLRSPDVSNPQSMRFAWGKLAMPNLINGAGLPASAFRAACSVKETDVPNIVFILVDDLRWDAAGCLGTPFLQTPNIDRIAREGVLFKNAFTTISLCSPSRAGFLTGTYPQINGVKKNEGRDPDPSGPNMGQLLGQAGYETAFIGKWHMKKGGQPRPGFDYWLSFDGQGTYTDPDFNENGVEFHRTGYMTDLLTDYAVDWLKKPRHKPFLLYFSHKAVHMEGRKNFVPAKRHEHLYEGIRIPEPPTWKNTLAGKPEWQRAAWVRGNRWSDWIKNKDMPVPEILPPPKWNEKLNGMPLRYFQTLAAVDESVGRIFQTLETLGELDNTVIVFSSDNGFHYPARARIRSDKRTAHEDSIRLPLLLRYPSLAKPGTQIDPMVLNIDLLPTLLDLAGAAIPSGIQGRSFKPLLEGRNVEWRTSFLYQYFMENYVPGIPGVCAVRTRDWVYMTYPDIKAHTKMYQTIKDMDELYNLQKDPSELNNLAESPEYKTKLRQMQQELDRLLKSASNTGCPQ